MKNRATAILALFVLHLPASFCHGMGFIDLTTGHDDLDLRSELRSAVLQTADGRAHLGRTAKLENIAFEAGVDKLTEVFGRPVDFSNDQVLPLLSRPSISISTLGGEAKTNINFFDLKGKGMLMVRENDFMKMPATVVLYLKTDAKFVPLKTKNKLKKRLKWEAKKLESLELEFEAFKNRIIEPDSAFNSD